jgi:dsDNA-specific endonuclease/ATPase MutS2
VESSRRQPPAPRPLHPALSGDVMDEETFQIPIEESIDLHAFRPADVRDVAREYLEAAHERGLAEVRLIHGRGRGVQRALIQQMLPTLVFVQSWRDDAHLGATVVVLAPNPLKSPSR